MNQLSSKKSIILLAGSTGSIGRSVLGKLINKNFTLICPVRQLSEIKKDGRKEESTLDICSSETVNELKKNHKKIDVIISCLGSKIGTFEDAREVELKANNNLLELAKHFRVKQFILLSAICTQKPKLEFQRNKSLFESYLKKSGINYTIIRPTAFFKSLSGQIKRVKEGKRFIVFDSGKRTKCKPISDDDLADFICTTINRKVNFNKTLNVGGPGPALSHHDIGTMLFRLIQRPPKFFYIPSLLFKIIVILTTPLCFFSNRVRDFNEFMRIGHYYATESMLYWDHANKSYEETKTPEYGKNTLENYYKEIISKDFDSISLPDKKLFS